MHCFPTRTAINCFVFRSSSDHDHDHPYSASGCDEASVEDANARICHTSHMEPCAQSMTGTLGLFVALSLHSAIEGLAIGVQNSSTKVGADCLDIHS